MSAADLKRLDKFYTACMKLGIITPEDDADAIEAKLEAMLQQGEEEPS